MNKYLIIGIVLEIVVLVALVLNSTTGLFSLNNKSTVKIGVLGTFTGIGSYFGQQELRGVEIAVDTINSRGGINGKQIELVVEDTQTDPNKAVLAVEKLITYDNVKFIVGDSWNNTIAPILSKTNDNKVILISGVATLDSLSKDDFFFRTVPSTNELMIKLADYIYNDGSRNLGVLKANTPFGVEHANDFVNEFKKLGGIVVGDESFELSSNDVRAEINKIKSKNPDTIFDLHGSGALFGSLLKQAKELDVNVKWLGSYSTENNILIKDYNDVADNIYYPYYYETDYNSEFVKQYQIKYNEFPDSTAANSYDDLMILAKAISYAGEDSIKVKDYLLNMPLYKGASGDILFDTSGDVKKNIFIKKVDHGEFVKVSN